MKTAYLYLRHGVPERRAAWHSGLDRTGYTVVDVDAPGSIRPKRDSDIYIGWNRHLEGAGAADRFAAAGCRVLITENATWGNGFMGGHWYTVARDYHNVAGTFRPDGAGRWDAIGAELGEWRTSDGETVVLASRGIGPIAHRQPFGWPEHAQRVHGGRIRRHPGNRPALPLLDDLKRAGLVVTWGSGAAVLALIAGMPIISHMPHWIAEQDNTDEGRLAMLQRLAWAQWRIEEIAAGEPIARLLT